MTLRDKILLYLIDNPNATNKEIAEIMEAKESNIKVEISRLKSKEFIEVKGTGANRTIAVLKEPKSKVLIDKRERYNRQLDFLEDIMFSDVDPKYRLEASAQHIRLLNKL
ncbi:winged helix-turn-helix transcriptional regulator [Listeria monocytogenes]|nr:winged helix-turn-helix transcriptional regulator [Listeria monocytogenes]EKP3813249.1 winged helix-turn-helix transcriptional regulator [Listeria monocytogenes]EKP3838241.1 winged helix-turn-helix transcriptional regulator [Listeria monocytogenes]EKP3853337.1 winged helix-turn-helix transcriptional regulator [Listeria monocytogenes]EKP3860586.1 winged helix-turn-helix transcriptional regulator [Listeria monocytogenes]